MILVCPLQTSCIINRLMSTFFERRENWNGYECNSCICLLRFNLQILKSAVRFIRMNLIKFWIISHTNLYALHLILCPNPLMNVTKTQQISNLNDYVAFIIHKLMAYLILWLHFWFDVSICSAMLWKQRPTDKS